MLLTESFSVQLSTICFFYSSSASLRLYIFFLEIGMKTHHLHIWMSVLTLIQISHAYRAQAPGVRDQPAVTSIEIQKHPGLHYFLSLVISSVVTPECSIKCTTLAPTTYWKGLPVVIIIYYACFNIKI